MTTHCLQPCVAAIYPFLISRWRKRQEKQSPKNCFSLSLIYQFTKYYWRLLTMRYETFQGKEILVFISLKTKWLRKQLVMVAYCHEGKKQQSFRCSVASFLWKSHGFLVSSNRLSKKKPVPFHASSLTDSFFKYFLLGILLPSLFQISASCLPEV